MNRPYTITRYPGQEPSTPSCWAIRWKVDILYGQKTRIRLFTTRAQCAQFAYKEFGDAIPIEH